MARSPSLHSIWFACMFGNFSSELRPVPGNNGSTSSYAHPWAQQFQDDICRWAGIEGGDSSACCAGRMPLEVRELQAAVFLTFLVPKKSEHVQVSLAATKEFADKAKRAKEGKCPMPLGEPHVHAWAVILRTALEDPALGDLDKQAIQSHQNTASRSHF